MLIVKKKVEGHGHTLYGKDGLGGLAHCVTKKISKKGFVAGIISLVVILVPLSIYGLEALKGDREDIANNKEQIIAIQKDIESINQTVKENQVSLEEIQTTVNEVLIKPEDLKKLITDAVKEGNK